MRTVLVVDDKEMMRDSVATTLQRAGFRVLTADCGERAIELVAARRPDAIVSDLKMPGMTGLELIERLGQLDTDLPIVLMTAFGTIETAVEAMRLGAFDYVTKPFEGDELIIAVKRAITHARIVRENAVLRVSGAGTPDGLTGVDRIIGNSPAIRRVKEQVAAMADSLGTVLICGESGSGKEVIARAIHEMGPRRDAPFLAVNCAALSASLLESELFGHERGAFTGADRLRKGRFELADGGTLLLDEISEIDPPLQAKLLRVLQERSFERVGSSLTIGVDVRVIATSNRDLPQAVASGAFRQDLFFRLNVLPLHLPPLRDRLDDVAELTAYFAGLICQREGVEVIEFDNEALAQMASYAWPGNVRELQNICERAVVLHRTSRRHSGEHPSGRIDAALIRPWLSNPGVLGSMVPGGFRSDSIIEAKTLGTNGHHQVSETVSSLDETGSPKTLAQIERETIVQTLRRFNGHRQKTARALGIGVRTLGLKLKKWKEMQLVEQTI